MISVKHTGDFSKIERYLKRISKKDYLSILHKYGARGVSLLSSATPIDTGETAKQWSYEIVSKDGTYTIQFNNSNVHDGVNIAIILQYGHGTKNGGYVRGRDYINPAIKQVFDEMVAELMKEAESL